MKQKYLQLFILLLLTSTSAIAQLTGGITTKKGEPIPFANIYIKEQMHGTSSDAKGHFSLHLDPGTYTASFQAIGYKPQTQTITINKKEVVVNVSLEEAIYNLKEVVVSNKDNPANRIMRKAISNGQLYKTRMTGYSSEVYFKANLLMTKLAKMVKWLTPKDAKLPIVGKTYTMEIMNRLTYKAPETYTQKTISYRTNFPGDDLEVPGIDIYRGSIYNDRYYGTPSPLGRQAFSCYKFFLIGSSVQEGATIFKIGVSPVYASGQFFKGFVYIKDNSYEIVNADLSEKIGPSIINLQISFDMVKNTIPMPTSIKIKQAIDLLGNSLSVNIISSVKYSNVQVKEENTPALAPVEAKAKPARAATKINRVKLNAINAKIQDLESKDDISLSEMKQMMKLAEKKKEMEDTTKSLEVKNIKIEKDSLFNTQDSTFWATSRPIPLSAEELRYSHEADSITALIPKGVAAPKDTAGTKSKWKPGAILLGGNFYKKKPTSIYTSGFIGNEASYFNPVDGYTLANRLSLETTIDSTKKLRITVRPMYSVSRKQMMGETELRFDVAPRRMAYIELSGRLATADVNLDNPVPQLINSISCIYFKSSFQKVMDTKGINAKFQIEVANGLNIAVTGRFNQRALLENNTNHSLLNKSSLYESNTPENIYLDRYPLSDYKQASVQLNISYTPSPRYRYDRKGYKYYISYNKPTFLLNADQGVGVLGSASTYTHLEFGVKQTVEVSMFNELSYRVKAGTFYNTKGMQLSDFYFPRTMYMPFSFESSKNSFTLLPYYKMATPASYIEAHACYESERIVLKLLPFLSRKMFSENIMVGYYTTGRYKNYTEVSYGLDKLLLVGGISAAARFENGKYSGWGVKAYFNLNGR